MGSVKRASVSLPAEAIVALVEGRIVEAIRAVREAEDLGFAEAKKIIERYIMCDAALRAQWVARRNSARHTLRVWVRGFLLLVTGLLAYKLLRT
jgi:hypothetical protein